jgi:hypothetical protein
MKRKEEIDFSDATIPSPAIPRGYLVQRFSSDATIPSTAIPRGNPVYGFTSTIIEFPPHHGFRIDYTYGRRLSPDCTDRETCPSFLREPHTFNILVIEVPILPQFSGTLAWILRRYTPPLSPIPESRPGHATPTSGSERGTFISFCTRSTVNFVLYQQQAAAVVSLITLFRVTV